MKILLDIFNYKKENIKKYHFFLFANRPKNNNLNEILSNNKNYHKSNAISVFFNTAEPLKYCSEAIKSKEKWIFFRLLAMNEKYGNFFRDLDLLNIYYFSKFFFIPDMLDPQFRNKNFMFPTIDYLLSKNIDIKNLHHFGLFDSDKLKYIKKHYPKNPDNKGTMSSGLWVYLYLKGEYPESDFTLVDYTFNIDPKYHSPGFEQGFFCNEIFSGHCDTI